MAQGMDGNPSLFDPRGKFRPPESALYAVDGHGFYGGASAVMTAPQSWEYQPRVSVSRPIPTKQRQCFLGQGDVSVYGAFSPVDVDQHSVFVDVGDFQIESFLKPQAAGIDGCQIGVIVKCLNLVEDAEHFFPTEDAWQTLFLLGLENLENMPFASDDVFIKKPDGAVANFHRVGRPLAIISSVEKIIPKFLFADFVRLFVEMLDQHPNGPRVALLSALAFPVDLKGLDGLVVPSGANCLCHDASPFVGKGLMGLERYYGKSRSV